jgi:hypothetical protein
VKKNGEWELPQDLAEMLRRLENVEARLDMSGQVAEENALAGGCYLDSRIAAGGTEFVGGATGARAVLGKGPLPMMRLAELARRAHNRTGHGQNDVHLSCQELLSMVDEIRIFRA